MQNAESSCASFRLTRQCLSVCVPERQERSCFSKPPATIWPTTRESCTPTPKESRPHRHSRQSGTLWLKRADPKEWNPEGLVFHRNESLTTSQDCTAVRYIPGLNPSNPTAPEEAFPGFLNNLTEGRGRIDDTATPVT